MIVNYTFWLKTVLACGMPHQPQTRWCCWWRTRHCWVSTAARTWKFPTHRAKQLKRSQTPRSRWLGTLGQGLRRWPTSWWTSRRKAFLTNYSRWFSLFERVLQTFMSADSFERNFFLVWETCCYKQNWLLLNMWLALAPLSTSASVGALHRRSANSSAAKMHCFTASHRRGCILFHNGGRVMRLLWNRWKRSLNCTRSHGCRPIRELCAWSSSALFLCTVDFVKLYKSAHNIICI